MRIRSLVYLAILKKNKLSQRVVLLFNWEPLSRAKAMQPGAFHKLVMKGFRNSISACRITAIRHASGIALAVHFNRKV